MIPLKLVEDLLARDDEGRRFFYEVFLNGEYEHAKTRGANKVIVDIGANVGNFSYYMYNSADSIYAIEANLKNYSDLQHYVERYALTKIRPFHLAMAGHNGMTKLYFAGGCGGFTIHENGQDLAEEVEAKTLNTFLMDNNIDHVDILKIDVEGAEKEIFSAPDIQEAAKKIDYIIGEGHAGANMNELLSSIGFTCDMIEGTSNFYGIRR